jgi:amino acid permease
MPIYLCEFSHIPSRSILWTISFNTRPIRTFWVLAKGVPWYYTSKQHLTTGAGILAMPFAMKSDGIILGALVIATAGFASGFGLYLQGFSSQFVPRGHASFFAISKVTYPSLAVIFDIAIAVKCFGVGVSYLIIIADLMPQISHSLGATSGWLLERDFWVLISMAVVGPLSFLRKLDSLKYTSLVALVSVGYLAIIVVAHFFADGDSVERGPVSAVYSGSISQVISTLPIIVFAFTCHQNMYSVMNELRDPCELSYRIIIVTSIASAGVFYLIVGVCGYLTFGDHVGGNIISMYPYNLFSIIGRIAIVILVIFSYPLQCHPCRASLNHVIYWLTTESKLAGKLPGLVTGVNSDDRRSSGERSPLRSSSDGNDESEESFVIENATAVPLSTARFIILTSLILTLSFITAATVRSLELMLAFVGSTGSTSISFILPGIFGYYLSSELVETSKRARLFHMASLGLVAWGTVVFVVCLGLNIVLLVRRD